MKAIIIENAGSPEVLQLAELPTPAIKPTEVLVQVKAIGINPVDVKTRQGKAFYAKLMEQPPAIIGWDISGTVTQVGAEVTDLKEGDEVFGMVNFPGFGKAYAEYVAAPAAHLAKKPQNISHQEAAATTLAALTAWQVLVHQANVQPAQKVLIHAAAGGVGHFAVQIAKHLGAYVIGTSSAANRDFVLSLGADEHIDYRQQQFEEQITDADMVFDTVGGEHVKRSLQAARKGGTVISIVGGFTEEVTKQAQELGIDGRGYLVQSSGADMQELAKLLEQGKLKAHVSLTVPLEEMAEAHRQVETGKTRGKVVVTV